MFRRLWSCSVIRNPDRVKKRLIPRIPAASLPRRLLGPTGSMCVASTRRMLIARQPSSTGSRSPGFVFVITVVASTSSSPRGRTIA